MIVRRLFVPLSVACATLVAVPHAASAAELFYAATSLNRLASFTSQAPGNVLSRAAITGLQPSEVVVSLDARPETGQLLATTNQGRLYVINPVNAAARAVGATPFPAPAATSFVGSDVNPVADRLRVVDDADRNFKVNPANGADNLDTALTYAVGDAGAGTNPAVDAIAYTNPVPGATTTELFAIDAGRDVLARITAPDSGSLTSVGALGVDAVAPTNFEIAAGNAGYAAMRVTGATGTRLFTVNLTTGATAATSTRNLIRLSDPIVGLAAMGAVPDDTTPPKTTVAGVRQVGSRYRTNVSCSEPCDATITLTRGSTTIGTMEFVMLKANALRRDVQLSAMGRSLLGAPGASSVTVTFTAVDQAGNAVT